MDSQKEVVQSVIEKCLEVIKTYEWLLNLYVLDFFVDNHWEKLPASWQQSLENMDPKDLGDIISGNQTKHILPLSLLALFKATSSLSIPRCGYMGGINNQAIGKYSYNHPKLTNLFLKHVKLKKRHEISMMADFVNMNAKLSNCEAVVDFGSGLGHLIRILSYKYSLHSVGIEMQTRLTMEARSVLCIYLVKFICIVGCCFMKLSCNTEPCGYPMSRYVGGMNSGLSYTSREIACHAIDTYSERLCRGEYRDLKVHAFRAALEKLLIQVDPSLKHMPIRSVKHTNNMTFTSYCDAALHRISMKPLQHESVERDLSQWKRVVILYTLRLALAPLVETVILLDRVLYMLENGISCAIYPVFDPKISPRNHIIVGRKS